MGEPLSDSGDELGATWDGAGVHFALFSANATAVDLCLFDRDAPRERERIALRRDGDLWRTYVAGAGPGAHYGYRVHGRWAPEEGHRFNSNKLVLDPYARRIVGEVRWHGAVFGHAVEDPHEDLVFDARDSAPWMPRCEVIDPAFHWGADARPAVPWRDTVVYELHVRGFTRLHPEVPTELRGTYAGLACEPVIDHLRRLGVTTVELMPVQAFVDEPRLARRTLRNYWGYNTIGFFAPSARYAVADELGEFRAMVRALHAAGLEVVLDVAYNHTGEGDRLGPTLAFRGIDNAAYYQLRPDAPRHYLDPTGTGNTLAMHRPHVRRLLADSLAWWVRETHVDGFRFDLAPALARDRDDLKGLVPFFEALRDDPRLAGIKLIAEPWDVGAGGYRLGAFPSGYREWNDRFRDTVRSFWRGDPGALGGFALRLAGSSDRFLAPGRGPLASLNFVTAHDGFTLHDLVSFERKHNEANGEGNLDGSDRNFSDNHGVEGPSADSAVRARRERTKRNLLATLLLSQGVPMLLAGDELGRTQKGNNNAYCQDNDQSWVDWTLDADRRQLFGFTCRLLALRRAHPAFRRSEFFRGGLGGEAEPDVAWLAPDGTEMTAPAWEVPSARSLMVAIAGTADASAARAAEPDDDHLLLVNADREAVDFRLPGRPGMTAWRPIFDTTSPEAPGPDVSFAPDSVYRSEGRSLALLVAEPRRTVLEAYRALGELHGITDGYHDVAGRWYPTSTETYRTLLAAMGVDAPDERAATARAEEERARRWSRPLPALVVVRGENPPLSFPLNLPAGPAGRSLHWRISTETGATHAGTLEVDALPVVERGEGLGWSASRHQVALDLALATGYHGLILALDDARLCEATLAVTPRRCYLPEALAAGRRIFGPALQLYAMRSERNFGIGDMTDLGDAVEQWHSLGADIVGLSPLHALDARDPARASPYSPSSRCFGNWLLLDPAALEDFAEGEAAHRASEPEFAAALRQARAASLVDYPRVAALKRTLLELAYASFRARHLAVDSPRACEFRTWRMRAGTPLERFALFEALRDALDSPAPAAPGWQAWPEHFRDPDSPAVAAFAAAETVRVEFFAYLQWQLDVQLGAAARRAEGMAVGLYTDLAVSADAGGAETWANRDVYALAAQVGAPPDEFSPDGQAWGLPPAIPDRLAAHGYAPFIATLRSAMRHAGAVRIDHVMQLARLFWIPAGGTAIDGAYVSYPLDDLLGLVALESVRHRCLVIGEDLGTVPAGLRQALGDAGLLSTRLLWFEREADGAFELPSDYPRAAAVAVSTHDLPTLAGWWKARDLAWRTKLARFASPGQRDRLVAARGADRRALTAALEREGLVVGLDPRDPERTMRDLAHAVHAFLARSPALVMLVQLEDLIAAVEQANLPGTVAGHPNWRRRLPLTLEAIAAHPNVRAIVAAIVRERGAPVAGS